MRHIKLYEDFKSIKDNKKKLFIDVKDEQIISEFIENSNVVDQESIDNIISKLEENCSSFIDELRRKNIEPLFRGTHKPVNEIVEIKADKFRIPKDLDMNISNIFNDCFRANFGVPIRSQGVFTSKSPYVTETYGKTQIFFPIGEYRYFWSPNVDDLYQYVDENLHNVYQYGIYSEEDDYDEEEQIYNFVDETVASYVDNQLDRCERQEITFVCDSYYLVEPYYYKAICEYLFGKLPE